MANDIKVPTGFLSSLETAAAGVNNAWPTGLATMTIEQVAMKQSDLQIKLAGYVAVFAAPGTLAKQHADAVVARDAAYEEAHTWLTAFFAALPAYVGKTSAGLAPFGKAPPKERAIPTAAESAVTTQKRNATRAARGTTSKKQKKISDFRNRLPGLDLGRIELRAVA
jgi:hypothetical protein